MLASEKPFFVRHPQNIVCKIDENVSQIDAHSKFLTPKNTGVGWHILSDIAVYADYAVLAYRYVRHNRGVGADSAVPLENHRTLFIVDCGDCVNGNMAADLDALFNGDTVQGLNVSERPNISVGCKSQVLWMPHYPSEFGWLAIWNLRHLPDFEAVGIGT